MLKEQIETRLMDVGSPKDQVNLTSMNILRSGSYNKLPSDTQGYNHSKQTSHIRDNTLDSKKNISANNTSKLGQEAWKIHQHTNSNSYVNARDNYNKVNQLGGGWDFSGLRSTLVNQSDDNVNMCSKYNSKEFGDKEKYLNILTDNIDEQNDEYPECPFDNHENLLNYGVNMTQHANEKDIWEEEQQQINDHQEDENNTENYHKSFFNKRKEGSICINDDNEKRIYRENTYKGIGFPPAGCDMEEKRKMLFSPDKKFDIIFDNDMYRRNSCRSINTPSKSAQKANETHNSVYPKTLEKNTHLLISEQTKHNLVKKDLYMESKKFCDYNTKNQIIDKNVRVLKRKKGNAKVINYEESTTKNKKGKNKKIPVLKSVKITNDYNFDKDSLSPMPQNEQKPQEKIIMFKDTFNENDNLNQSPSVVFNNYNDNPNYRQNNYSIEDDNNSSAVYHKDSDLYIPSQTSLSRYPEKINLYRSGNCKHHSTGDLNNYDQQVTNQVISLNVSKDYENYQIRLNKHKITNVPRSDVQISDQSKKVVSVNDYIKSKKNEIEHLNNTQSELKKKKHTKKENLKPAKSKNTIEAQDLYDFQALSFAKNDYRNHKLGNINTESIYNNFKIKNSLDSKNIFFTSPISNYDSENLKKLETSPNADYNVMLNYEMPSEHFSERNSKNNQSSAYGILLTNSHQRDEMCLQTPPVDIYTSDNMNSVKTKISKNVQNLLNDSKHQSKTKDFNYESSENELQRNVDIENIYSKLVTKNQNQPQKRQNDEKKRLINTVLSDSSEFQETYDSKSGLKPRNWYSKINEQQSNETDGLEHIMESKYLDQIRFLESKQKNKLASNEKNQAKQNNTSKDSRNDANFIENYYANTNKPTNKFDTSKNLLKADFFKRNQKNNDSHFNLKYNRKNNSTLEQNISGSKMFEENISEQNFRSHVNERNFKKKGKKNFAKFVSPIADKGSTFNHTNQSIRPSTGSAVNYKKNDSLIADQRNSSNLDDDNCPIFECNLISPIKEDLRSSSKNQRSTSKNQGSSSKKQLQERKFDNIQYNAKNYNQFNISTRGKFYKEYLDKKNEALRVEYDKKEVEGCTFAPNCIRNLGETYQIISPDQTYNNNDKSEVITSKKYYVDNVEGNHRRRGKSAKSVGERSIDLSAANKSSYSKFTSNANRLYSDIHLKKYTNNKEIL